MKYCPKCGRQILDEGLGCPVCSMSGEAPAGTTENGEVSEPGATEPEQKVKVELVKEFTVEDGNGQSQKFETKTEPRSWESYQQAEPTPVQEQTIPTVLKVIVILAVIMTAGIGSIAGLIAGIVLLKSPLEDYRKFGKTLIIISCVMIGAWLLCCFVGGLFGIVGNISYYYY